MVSRPSDIRPSKVLRQHLAYRMLGTRRQGERFLRARKDIEDLRELTGLLPDDEWQVREVSDTNVSINDPDVASYVPFAGERYLVRVLPGCHARDQLVALGGLWDQRQGITRSPRGSVLRSPRPPANTHVIAFPLEPLPG